MHLQELAEHQPEAAARDFLHKHAQIADWQNIGTGALWLSRSLAADAKSHRRRVAAKDVDDAGGTTR